MLIKKFLKIFFLLFGAFYLLLVYKDPKMRLI